MLDEAGVVVKYDIALVYLVDKSGVPVENGILSVLFLLGVITEAVTAFVEEFALVGTKALWFFVKGD